MNARLFFLLILSTITQSVMADESLESRRELLSHGIKRLAFVKRFTYTATNFYTEHINSNFTPGGNLCVLDLETGEVKELCPELSHGVFERMDVSFDASRIVFAWKASPEDGYRIYEVHTDGTNLRQVVSTPTNEARIVRRYPGPYRHGTDDMSPCYLPDGGICFVSTRCQHGITCDAPDILTTSVLYRCHADGSNITKLSNSPLSEMSPSIMSDGRILYTRWEYVDKGANAVKCLWAMRPDGTFTSEIFGNNIALPPTFIFGREIPDAPGYFVCTGGPHAPYAAMGPIIRINTHKDIRSRESMESMTPDVDIRGEAGWVFRDKDGIWSIDQEGRGPLFKEAFPVTKDLFIVSHKPQGEPCNSPNGYGLYLLNSRGEVWPLYRDTNISCWNSIPLEPRKIPPQTSRTIDPDLAQKNLALCLVLDVYHGMENTAPSSVKYLRVLEQVPRPWSARRFDFDDEYDQQHAVISRGTHLVLKVQHGIVPVEKDGSANFLVPAGANIFFQALDENYMALQTERTHVHYAPGEVRSCLGCHERSSDVSETSTKMPMALIRDPQLPGPQPGESTGQRAIDYVLDVQPIWDKHCIECHSGTEPKGNLNLSGEMTMLFNTSYENLVPPPFPDENAKDRELLGNLIRENYPKIGHAEYLPPMSYGSHTSVLVAVLAEGKITLADPTKQQRAEHLQQIHKEVHLSQEELLKVTNWIDTNCQYYGTYFGRRNLKFQGRRDFRPPSTFEDARQKREIPLEIEN